MVTLMAMAKLQKGIDCQHIHSEATDHGLALIVIGETDMDGESVASHLCDALSPSVLENVCRFDLAEYAGHLKECLGGHKAAIIVDSREHAIGPGTIMISDLNSLSMMKNPHSGEPRYSELVSEIRQAGISKSQAQSVILFEIGIGKGSEQHKIISSVEKNIPALASRLSGLISTVLQTLKRSKK